MRLLRNFFQNKCLGVLFCSLQLLLGCFHTDASISWHLVNSEAACAQTPVICPKSVQLSENDVIIHWLDASNSTLLEEIFPLRHGMWSRKIESRIFPYNIFAGLEFEVGTFGNASVNISDSAKLIVVNATSVLLSSQRKHSVEIIHSFEMSMNAAEPKTLVYSVQSGLPEIDMQFRYTSSPPLHFTNTKKETRQHWQNEENDGIKYNQNEASVISDKMAYNLIVSNETLWSLASESFQNIAMAISLQGLVNRHGPMLYLTYPPDWAFSYTDAVRKFVSKSQGIAFTELKTPLEALSTLWEKLGPDSIKGFVVYDPQVRDSLVVSYTIAGVKSALVASPALAEILSAPPYSLPCLVNLTAENVPAIRTNSSAEIFQWAYNEYSGLTNSSMLVWAGGVCPDKMQTAIGDYGVSNRAFFVDLNTVDPAHNPSAATPAEYELADHIVGKLSSNLAGGGSPPLIVGWHSYCSDYEHTFTSLMSKHGARVHGLDTNPNLSFMSKLSLPKNYVFKNKGRRPEPLDPSRAKMLHKKVLVTLVQTDGLGLGAWAKGGRGTLPYSWEVTLPDLQIQPVILQMFYEQATPNDTFVGALGANGYSYPRAIPPDLLPSRLQYAQQSMRTLDLDHFVVFDASHAVGEHTVTGDTCLSSFVVDEYFRSMPDCVGFLNGYGATFTFRHDAGGTNHSLVSFDYYLDPGRSVADAIQDLETLAELNPVRPYFLAIHVREFSTVGKVIDIIDGLDSSVFEVVPVGDFFKIANKNPTWKDRYT